MKEQAKRGETAGIIPRYLTAEQAAEYLSLAPSTLYDWVAKKRIPFVEFPGKKGRHHNGGTLRFDRLALDRFMRQHSVKPLAVWESSQNP